MISDIYLMAFTMQRNYYDEPPFHEIILEQYPKYADEHLPRGAKLESIEYKEDGLVSAFMEMVVEEWIMTIETMVQKGIKINIGVYKIQINAEKDLTRSTIVGMEYLFQEMHQQFGFISSIFLYPDEDGLKLFVKLKTFESDEEDTEGFDLDYINDYTGLFLSHFYEDEIPDSYAAEVVKWFLTDRKI